MYPLFVILLILLILLFVLPLQVLRSDIWKSAIEVFLTSPVVGVSHNNVLAYVYDNVPNSYLVTNDHMDFDSMHNVFFDILVGQGVIGLAIYLAMLHQHTDKAVQYVNQKKQYKRSPTQYLKQAERESLHFCLF